MQKQSNFFIKAGPLLLVLFIDGMGLSLVFPILNELIFSSKSTFLPLYLSTPLMSNVVYGAIVGIFMLCWFFGAAILGDLSDKIGRKKSLLICLAGAFLSYLISALSVSLSSVSLLFLGRIVAGFTSGSQPIAQAAIVDLSEPQDKTRNIGFILLALSLGFVIGPLLGGLLSDNRIVSWFNFSTPFYFAAMVSFLNVLLLLWLFDESFIAKRGPISINFYQAIHLFASAFKHEKVRILSVLFFIFIFGWSSFYSFVSLFLLKVYSFTPTDVSLFMAVMGIGFGIGNGFLTNYFAKLFPLRENFIYSTLVAAVIIFLMIVVHNSLFNWIMVVLLACSIAVSYGSVLTLFSNQVDANSQGWVMGITGSIMALVWAVNGVVVGCAAALNAALPIFIAALTLFLASLFPYFFYKPAVS